MKRGLVALELPDAVRADAARRVQRLRERMSEAGCVAALVYGDVSRSDDLAYLGTLCVYWNEGVLVVPAAGDVAFATKLSPRVHPWMRASSTVSDLRSGPDLPKLIARVLAEASAASRPRIGLVERDGWPSGLLGDLIIALPDVEFVDLAAVVRAGRLQPDARELEELRRLGRVVSAAATTATEVTGPPIPPAVRIGGIERSVRCAGMTDVFASAEQAADGSVTAGVVAQLQHLWLRAARTSGGPLAEHALAGAARAAAALADGATEATVATAVNDGVSPEVELTTRCVRHVDLTPDGDGRRVPDQDGPLRHGQVVAVAVTASDARGRAIWADTYLIADGPAIGLSHTEAPDR